MWWFIQLLVFVILNSFSGYKWVLEFELRLVGKACQVCACVCVFVCVGGVWGGYHGYHDYTTKLPWQPEQCMGKRRVWKIIQMKSEGVTSSQIGKLYFLKYRYHLGTFSFKILYSRCIFVKQGRVIFSNITWKEQWLNVIILRKSGNWLHSDARLNWHLLGLHAT